MYGVGAKEWITLLVFVGLLAVGLEHCGAFVWRNVHVSIGAGK